jgi:ABC-type thiamine transport system ATPase subunit
MLAGFEEPSSGKIFIDGLDMSGIPPYERPVNMMFQSYALFPHMTVDQNVGFGLKMEHRSRSEIADRVAHMLKLVRLFDEFGKRKPEQLSGGQRQRVALARALIKQPKLLLLDEPLGALDKKLREHTQFELVNLQEELGVTFVVVTHDQEEAMTLSSRIGVMDHGKIVQVGTPQEIYESPGNRFVAEFVGSVNLFEGQLTASEAESPAHPLCGTRTSRSTWSERRCGAPSPALGGDSPGKDPARLAAAAGSKQLDARAGEGDRLSGRPVGTADSPCVRQDRPRHPPQRLASRRREHHLGTGGLFALARQQPDDRQRMKPEAPSAQAAAPAAERFAGGSRRAARRHLQAAALPLDASALTRWGISGRTAVIAVPYLWLLLFFVVPFVIVLKISFSETQIAMPPYQPLLEWAGERLSDIRLNVNPGNFLYLIETASICAPSPIRCRWRPCPPCWRC